MRIWRMGPRLTPAARTLLVRQRGVLACWQGPSVGVSTRSLRSAARRNEDWRWVGFRTVALSAGPLSPSQLRVVACLEAGSTAALGGMAALQELGLQQETDGKVDVILPRGKRSVRCRVPRFVRIHYADGLRTTGSIVQGTTGARAVVDGASWARTDREAMFIATVSLQQDLTRVDKLEDELRRRHGIKRCGIVREVLAEFAAGSHSMGELDFVRECRRRGFPEPARQTRRRDGAGRRRFTDAEFYRSDGRIVMVEIDGIGHMTSDTWLADMERHNDLAVSTEAMVLRVSALQLRRDAEPFFARLAVALELWGERAGDGNRTRVLSLGS